MAASFRSGSGRPAGAALRAVPGVVRRVVPASLEAAGALLVQQIKVELSTEGRGRFRRHTTTQKGAGSYRKVAGQAGGKRRTKGVPLTDLTKASRASAPGDPPAPDTGSYRNSIGMERVTIAGKPGIRVGTGDARAEPLEFGTTTAGRTKNVTILPRPHFRPAFGRVRDVLRGRFAVELRARAKPGIGRG